jgi:hypothetical protein
MIRDKELIFCGTKASGAAITVGMAVSASGANNATYDIDTLAAGNAIKSGAVLHVIATELCAGTGTTLTITLVTDNDVAFGSATTLWSSGAIAKAATVAGTVLAQSVIPVGVERYLRLIATTDNTFQTTGAIAAWIDLNQEVGLDKQY